MEICVKCMAHVLICQICVNIDLKLNCLIQWLGESHRHLVMPDKLNYNIMFNLVYKVVNFGFVCFQFSGPYTFEGKRILTFNVLYWCTTLYAVFTITDNQRTTLFVMCKTIKVYELPDICHLVWTWLTPQHIGIFRVTLLCTCTLI